MNYQLKNNYKLGDIVWAKVKGYSWWPGRIGKVVSNIKYIVIFYYDDTYAELPLNKILDFKENLSLKNVNNDQMKKAFALALFDYKKKCKTEMKISSKSKSKSKSKIKRNYKDRNSKKVNEEEEDDENESREEVVDEDSKKKIEKNIIKEGVSGIGNSRKKGRKKKEIRKMCRIKRIENRYNHRFNYNNDKINNRRGRKRLNIRYSFRRKKNNLTQEEDNLYKKALVKYTYSHKRKIFKVTKCYINSILNKENEEKEEKERLEGIEGIEGTEEKEENINTDKKDINTNMILDININQDDNVLSYNSTNIKEIVSNNDDYSNKIIPKNNENENEIDANSKDNDMIKANCSNKKEEKKPRKKKREKNCLHDLPPIQARVSSPSRYINKAKKIWINNEEKEKVKCDDDDSLSELTKLYDESECDNGIKYNKNKEENIINDIDIDDDVENSIENDETQIKNENCQLKDNQNPGKEKEIKNEQENNIKSNDDDDDSSILNSVIDFQSDTQSVYDERRKLYSKNKMNMLLQSIRKKQKKEKMNNQNVVFYKMAKMFIKSTVRQERLMRNICLSGNKKDNIKNQTDNNNENGIFDEEKNCLLGNKRESEENEKFKSKNRNILINDQIMNQPNISNKSINEIKEIVNSEKKVSPEALDFLKNVRDFCNPNNNNQLMERVFNFSKDKEEIHKGIDNIIQLLSKINSLNIEYDKKPEIYEIKELNTKNTSNTSDRFSASKIEINKTENNQTGKNEIIEKLNSILKKSIFYCQWINEIIKQDGNTNEIEKHSYNIINYLIAKQEKGLLNDILWKKINMTNGLNYDKSNIFTIAFNENIRVKQCLNSQFCVKLGNFIFLDYKEKEDLCEIQNNQLEKRKIIQEKNSLIKEIEMI